MSLGLSWSTRIRVFLVFFHKDHLFEGFQPQLNHGSMVQLKVWHGVTKKDRKISDPFQNAAWKLRGAKRLCFGRGETQHRLAMRAIGDVMTSKSVANDFSWSVQYLSLVCTHQSVDAECTCLMICAGRWKNCVAAYLHLLHNPSRLHCHSTTRKYQKNLKN